MVDKKFQKKLVRLPKRPGQRIGCLVWVGAKHKQGYGKLVRFIDGKKKEIRATHWAWLIYFGVWPITNVLHHCDNPPCCEETHLFEGSIGENNKDRDSKRRTWKIYSDEVVEAIIKFSGTYDQMEVEFGISRTQAWRIRHGIHRRHRITS